MNKKLKIEQRDPSKLTGYARNSRIHDDAQIEQICKSIDEFGFLNPVLIDPDDGIIAGHGRVAAAMKMSLKAIPVIVLAHLTPEQKQAYVIADNKLALNARWDETLLTLELKELAEYNFEATLTGFNEMEIATRLDDVVADPKSEWVDMPEFEANSAEAFRTMIVHCPNEEDWNAFVRALGLQKFTSSTKFVWWPEAERDETKDLRAVSASGG